MIRAILALVPPWLWALLLAIALATSAGIGWRQGAAKVKAKWTAAELHRQQDEAEQRIADQQRAHAAAAEFEALRAELASRRMEVANGLRNALSAPISCPAGTLADVRVPAAAVGSLRAAGADHGAPSAAASQPRR